MFDRLKSVSVLVTCLGAAWGVQAQPQPVVRRLTEYGELSVPQARALQKAVSKRMKRAASRDPHDVVRAAVTRAVLASSSSDKGKRSKRANPAQVRRRLRAGLDVWALEHVFVPSRNSMEMCDRGFGLSSNLCEALLAAGGGVSLAGAHVLGGGSEKARSVQPSEPQDRVFASVAPGVAHAKARHEAQASDAPSAAPVVSDRVRLEHAHSAQAGLQRPTGVTHESSVAALSAPGRAPIVQPAAAAAPTRQNRISAPVAAPPPVAAPAPEPKPSAATLADIARRKAEYQRQRDAYLERRRSELEARKARFAANSAAERVQRGPASELEAQVVGITPKSVPAPEAQGKKASASSRPAPRPAQPAPNADEVDDLVGDLLSK